MVSGCLRGHLIYYDGDIWRYQDDNSSVPDNWEARTCGYCGEHTTAAGHDYCIANLPNVHNACCGHGNTAEAYVQFTDGRELRGQVAVEYQHRWVR